MALPVGDRGGKPKARAPADTCRAPTEGHQGSDGASAGKEDRVGQAFVPRPHADAGSRRALQLRSRDTAKPSYGQRAAVGKGKHLDDLSQQTPQKEALDWHAQ